MNKYSIKITDARLYSKVCDILTGADLATGEISILAQALTPDTIAFKAKEPFARGLAAHLSNYGLTVNLML